MMFEKVIEEELKGTMRRTAAGFRAMKAFSQTFGKFLIHGFETHPGLVVARSQGLDPNSDEVEDWTYWQIVHGSGRVIFNGFLTDDDAANASDLLADGLDWTGADLKDNPAYLERCKAVFHICRVNDWIPLSMFEVVGAVVRGDSQ
jgi:hypothetical protein